MVEEEKTLGSGRIIAYLSGASERIVQQRSAAQPSAAQVSEADWTSGRAGGARRRGEALSPHSVRAQVQAQSSPALNQSLP